jgi:hypothetical protein
LDNPALGRKHQGHPVINDGNFRRSHRAAYFGAQVSFVALAAAIPAHAWAQCSPDPTQANTAVTCSGSDSNGIAITTNASPLTVASGASVTNAGSPAIAVSIPATSAYSQRSATITVNGSVASSGAAGIGVQSGSLGSAPCDYYGTTASITVGASGSVTGTYGISATQTSGNSFGAANIALNNAGSISGTSGVALSLSGGSTSSSWVVNQAGGTIGAIQGNLSSLTNAGTINGGSLSAIAPAAGTSSYYGSITNSGTITSAGTAATVLNYLSQITNSGTISNTGSGAAIDSNSLNINNLAGGTITASNSSVLGTHASSLSLINAGTISNTGNGAVVALNGASLNVTNQAGGVISAAVGNTALSAAGYLTLVNQGTITGNVTISGNALGYLANSTVDSTGGIINGNLMLGSGNDTLTATVKNGSLYTGITGTIDGGGGTNTLLLKTTTDATLSSAPALPTHFSVLDLAPGSGTTLTLANGFTSPGTISFDGAGTLDNQTVLSGTGTIITSSNYSSYSTLKNSGTITSSNSGGGAAIVLGYYGILNNTGTITATGQGVNVSGGFTNSGTITAGGTAVSSGGSFNNSGIIGSTGGTGASIGFSCTCGTGTNSGSISGATTGVALGNGTLVNTGTIQGGTTGVLISSYGTLDNRAGGVVTGGTVGVAGGGFNNQVINAGTINGNVNLSNGATTYQYINANTYYAVTGGVLNGNLTLGQGDTLVTDLVNPGTSTFAGINGTVNANNSNLIYNVSADASVTTTPANGFTSLGFQLANNAALSLAGKGASAATLSLAGTGSVDLTGSLATSNIAAIQVPAIQKTPSGNSGAASALTITNDGTITTTRTNAGLYPSGTLVLGTGTSLVNNGSISASDISGGTFGGMAAVSTASALVNNGTITGSGAYGVVIGSSYNGITLANNGQISSDRAAILLDGGVTVTNSGTITSSATSAISDISYNATSNVNNLAGGVISGVGTAVQMAGGTLTNAGTINGNVNLGYVSSGGYYYAAGTYVANGGTVNGNLSFGAGNDVLVETGSGYGVTGTIDGGFGTNVVAHQRSGTATVMLGSALPTGFSQEFTVAAGAASQVTITGPSAYTGNIYVSGDGSIINQLATTGIVYPAYTLNTAYSAYTNAELAGFSNRANIGGVFLTTGTFDNSATIGGASLMDNAVSLYTAKGFTFGNSGTIASNGSEPAVLLYGNATTGNSTIANSGVIAGGISASISAAVGTTVGITNSGTITGYSQSYYGFDPATFTYNLINTPVYAVQASVDGAKSLTFANSGTITGGISLAGADVTLVNTGSITGDITTGAGNDSIAMNGVFAGSVDGGTGTNTLSVNGGTQSAPVAFASVSNIAALTQTGGFATVSGTGTFGTVTLTGGRLVGLKGSVLNAASFNVGAKATFGSAGTVNGNVIVSGTLSPGASPGTMTVNGNVTLNSGSTSLFEITPTVSDKLIVNGNVAIQPGSTLQIAASSPVKVGSTLDLITASGGVSGMYDTVTGLAGTVRKLANGDLGLLVQFTNPDSFNPQVRRAIAYVNSAMAASSAPAALTSALGALQDGNAAPIASAFARLTPEPYADAMQIGTETALSLSGNARTIGEGETGGPTHLFGFGQGLGSLRQFASHEEQGVSHATINGFGALGGLGVAGRDYAVSGYVGWVEQDQSIAALGASTRARGVVGGVAARFGEVTRITLSANYDASHALTRRDVPDAGTISTSYALPSWSFDASLSRALPLGQGWLLRPQVGTTWVMTSHDAIAEASAHPFALNVAAADQTQGFVDAGLGFETAPDAQGPWRRFLTLGARYRVQGDQTLATAALAGYTSSLTALGVGRNRVDVTMAAGVEYRLAPGASLFLNASGELGKAGKRESVTSGVRFRL